MEVFILGICREIFFFFFFLCSVLYMGAHYTRVNTVYSLTDSGILDIETKCKQAHQLFLMRQKSTSS